MLWVSPQQLGMVLFYMKGLCFEWNISFIFGVTPSAVNRYINIGILLLLRILRFHPSSRVRWPSPDEMEKFYLLLREKKPELGETKIFGFVDGFKLRMDNPVACFAHNADAFYSGHKKFYCVSNIVVYTPDGGCCFYSINYPGSWHDSRCSSTLYDKLKNNTKTPQPYKIVGDQGFGNCDGRIIITKERKTDDSELAFGSIRQYIEHSINTIVTSWPRLRVVLGDNTEKNTALIELAIHLVNYKARVEGVNQVLTL